METLFLPALDIREPIDDESRADPAPMALSRVLTLLRLLAAEPAGLPLARCTRCSVHRRPACTPCFAVWSARVTCNVTA